MSFGITATVITGLAVAGASIYGANKQADAAQAAAGAQSEAANAGIAENRRQFDALQKLLSPYVQAGNQGLQGQMDLNGMNGGEAQGKAIDALQRGSGYQRTIQTGQSAILSNGSATGGLRGGNIQGALAGFSADALNNEINNQYNRLGQMTTLGQNSAAGVGAAGMQSANQIAGLYGQQGAAQAGGYLAQGQADQAPLDAIMAGLGVGSQVAPGLNSFFSGLNFGASNPTGGGLTPQNNLPGGGNY